MSEFKKEDRYIVIKRKELAVLDSHDQKQLNTILNKMADARAFKGKPPLECVVVESDWPIYDMVWDAVSRFALCRPQAIKEAMVNALAEALNELKIHESDIATDVDLIQEHEWISVKKMHEHINHISLKYGVTPNE